jgi:signal transduction histidine kinase/PAS domain-containing protein/ActR/RegA family two-component response regulator
MASLETLKELLDQVACGIGIYEIADGKMAQLYLNSTHYELLDDTRENREKYAMEHFCMAIHPDDRALFEEKVRQVAQGEQRSSCVYRVIDGSGEYVWFRFDARHRNGTNGRKLAYCAFFNIDEQMRTQLALKNEQMLLTQAMQAARMSSWEYDAAKKRLCQTEASQRQHGLERVLENVPESLIERGFVHPDSAQVYRRLFTPARGKEDIHRGDVLVRSPDDSGYWWEHITVAPIFDHHGNYVRSIGTTIDVTERKNAEERYQKQVEEMSTFNSPNLLGKGVYNLSNNRDGYYYEMDSGTVNRIVRSYEQGLAVAAGKFFNPSAAQDFLRLFDRKHLLEGFAQGNTAVSLAHQRKSPSGRIFWAQFDAKLFQDPNTGDVMCFIYSYDINEHRMAQETIHTVIRQDYDYFALLDCRTGNYSLYAEDTAKGTLLPRAGENYNDSVRDFAHRYVVPEDVERIIADMTIENIRRQLQTQESFTSYITMQEKDGSLHRKKLQFTYQERENELVLISRMDVTDIYQQEQARLNALRDAAQALQQANSVKTDFLSRMSHDLRTPMNAVIGLTELARDELNDPAAMEKYLEDIHSAGQFLVGLVNDCLDFEKISANRMQLKCQPYTYEQFRRSIDTIIGTSCREKGIQLICAYQENIPSVMVDPVRFEQIFINLLTNAVKFTPPGGTVKCQVTNCTIHGETLSCSCVVQDNGIGMSEEFQKRMYEPFEQESSEYAMQSQGTGLGLAIVKSLVELMHGTITVKSKQGVGTKYTLHFDLPLASAEQKEEKYSPTVTTSLAGRHILLVEDQPINTEIAKKLLEKRGMIVSCAANGQEGVSQFQTAGEHAFDAVLMDIRMPVMDGLAATRAIRALPRPDAATVPIIAMTANAFYEDVCATQEAGMNGHLSKPVDPQLLLQTLEKWIAGRTEPS